MIALPLILAAALQGGPVRLEASASPASPFVHEPVRLTLRVTLDARFEREDMVQMFQRPLDVPVQIRASWLEHLDGAIALSGAEAGTGADTRTVALNDTVVRASARSETDDGGRALTVLEFHRDFLPDRPGELRFPSVALHYASATSFRDDLLGRVPLDRTDAEVESPALAIVVRPLPEEGRPAEFTGAVGRLSVRVDVEPRRIALGESLKLTLTVTGRGNLHRFEAPRLEGFEDFHVYAHIEEKAPGRRTITYDIAPRSVEVSEVPSFSFAYFSPEPPAGYRSVATEAIPVLVLPERPVGPRPERFAADPATPGTEGTGSSRIGFALVAMLLLLIGLVALRARTRGPG